MDEIIYINDLITGQMNFTTNDETMPTRVQYIQCNGQYIETGLQVSNYTGYQLEIKYRFTSYNIGAECWCMGYWNDVPERRLYLAGYYHNYIRCGAGPDISGYHCDIPIDSNWHVAELKLDGAYFDGVKGANCNLYSLPLPQTSSIWLGRSPHIDSGDNRQIEYCKMWTVDGQLVRDFVPVKFINESNQTEGAFYDQVSRQLFKSNINTPFIAGPDF